MYNYHCHPSDMIRPCFSGGSSPSPSRRCGSNRLCASGGWLVDAFTASFGDAGSALTPPDVSNFKAAACEAGISKLCNPLLDGVNPL